MVGFISGLLTVGSVSSTQLLSKPLPATSLEKSSIISLFLNLARKAYNILVARVFLSLLESLEKLVKD